MKAVILAGGLGTRLSEQTHLKPKPMVEIGDRPILWHIMKIYSSYGINDFIICLGYKGYLIKEYFANYFLHVSDVTFDIVRNEKIVHQDRAEPWRVTLIDTGEKTSTGGRLKRVFEHICDEEAFCLTYGDGLANLDIQALIKFHIQHGKLATVTAVQPPGRFGALKREGSSVSGFTEKPQGDGVWINGGFFVFDPKVVEYIGDDEGPLEAKPLETIAKNGQLQAFEHRGFWQPMDTVRDRNKLEELWVAGKAPWKSWR